MFQNKEVFYTILNVHGDKKKYMIKNTLQMIY